MAASEDRFDRRGFLRGAAALAGIPPVAMGQAVTEPADRPSSPAGGVRPGADFMVDVFKTLGIEYCAANPGSSFKGLQESFINYGGKKNPEGLTPCHEE